MGSCYKELTPLHEALKEIVKDFDDICRRAGVSFCLIYGTMLGAARHQDIIPWDDDVDLGMFRQDYEKLIQYFIKNDEPGYKLFCSETSNEHMQIFAKLVRVDGKYDYLAQYYTHVNGLSIDVFPLDEAMDQARIWQKIKGEWIVHLRRVVTSKAKLKDPHFKEPLLKHVVRFLMVLPFLAIDNHSLLIHINNLCKQDNGKGYPNIINYSTTDRLYKENDPKEDWLPTTDLLLGDLRYSVPGKYERILSHIYGDDWAEMPPESVREQHTHMEI